MAQKPETAAAPDGGDPGNAGAPDQPEPTLGTLAQIAAMAGVHPSTASRVLRQSEPARGWSAAALRVLEAAEQLGYRSNLLAAGLRNRRTRTIGLVLPRLQDYVVAALCQAIESTARLGGYHVLLTTPPDDMTAQMDSVELLLSRRVDGIIMTGLHREESVFEERLAALPVPVVAANRRDGAALASVACDDLEGGRLATEHLLSLGHERIGIVAGPRHAASAWDRLTGYREALAAHDLAADESLVVHTQFDVGGGVLGGHTLLSLAEPPTAIFAVNDTAAVGVMAAAYQRGLHVPDDLSLVGFNDIPLSAHLPIPLTSVRSDLGQMGALAVHELLRAIDGGEARSQTLPVALVVRSTTKAR
ncbi:MAG: LacI family transcriptional regulator [Propionibacteriaceae bacterium]|jgi:LacI family transcriptional regulator|nr:LacI family transcriptional regulator [Propionibacteriaceae bacterium]